MVKINNEFTVSVPVDKAWNTMLDLEKIAPCLPGAAIQEEKGDGEYDGTMKVKIGPITANYKGTVKFEEADEANHRAVLEATGRDARGQGTASATIVSTLTEEGSGNTKVSVETDMKLTGRTAQFGRGVAQDVATTMLNRFAECLEQELSSGSAAAGTEAQTAPAEIPDATNGSSGDGSRETAPATPIGGTAGRSPSSEDPSVMTGGAVEGAIVSGGPSVEAAEPEAFDLGAAGSEALLGRLKGAAPVLAGVGALVAVVVWLVRRRRQGLTVTRSSAANGEKISPMGPASQQGSVELR